MSLRKWRRKKVQILKEMPPTKDTGKCTVNVLHAGREQTLLRLLLFSWLMKVMLYSVCVMGYPFCLNMQHTLTLGLTPSPTIIFLLMFRLY